MAFGHFNSETTSTNKKGRLGSIEQRPNKESISNILSISNLKYIGFHITYDKQNGHYVVKTKDREVHFNKY